MISSKIYVKATGDGPFQFDLSLKDKCTDVTFSYGDMEGVNALSFTSNARVAEVGVSWDGSCKLEDLGILSVEGSNGECRNVFEKALPNPCTKFSTDICPQYSDVKGTQKFLAQTVGGNYPFEYSWDIKDDSITIIEDGQVLCVKRNKDEEFILCLTVTDCNGCTAERTITVPKITSERPVAKSLDITRPCNQEKTEPFVIDLLGQSFDLDGTIALGSIEIVSGPVCGSWDLNQANGLFTYVPGNGCTGTETIAWRVQDNNGNWSEVATVVIVIDPCEIIPIANNEVSLAECGEQICLDVLANDPNADPTTLEVISGPLHGSYDARTDGTICYTPEDDYVGYENIRYCYIDNDGKKSEIGTWTINVQTCCGVVSAGLEIQCDISEGQICIDAEKVSSNNAVWDRIYVDSGSGYVLGDRYCVDQGNCDFEEETGLIEIENSAGAIMDVVELSTNQFQITITMDGNPGTALLAQIRDQINDCNGFIYLIPQTSALWPAAFLTQYISFVVSSSFQLQFQYNNSLDVGLCSQVLNNDTLGTRNLLNTVDGSAQYTAPEDALLTLQCFEIIAEREVFFKRVVIRDGCPDAESVYRAVLNANGTCDDVVITKLSGPENPENNKNSYEVCIEDLGDGGTVEQVVVDGQNILQTTLEMPGQEGTLEFFINAQYGAKTTVMFFEHSGKLLMRIKDVEDAVFNSIMVDGESYNFINLTP